MEVIVNKSSGDEGLLEHEGKKQKKEVCLVWEDLTVIIRNNSNYFMNRKKKRGTRTRKLLNGLTGFAESGRIMAIMGPSGSGKSTFLDALAGRLSSNVTMAGNVLINGRKRGINCKNMSYGTQQDVFLGTLTVKETLYYSAHLRLPTTMTKHQMNEIVEDTISKMGLQDCANNKIGNWHLRGISGGERRRLSISIEILTKPCILFLDEPTSGLDSASSFFVIQVLRNIALDGRIVMCSIHQPSIDVFNLFDDLFLLSDGEAVYFGEAKMAIKFFNVAGFPCPRQRSPPDHFLRCISSDFDKIVSALKQTQRYFGFPESSNSLVEMTTTDIKAMLVKKYQSSIFSWKARKKIQEITFIVEKHEIETKTSYPGWWKQLGTLTRRSSLHMSRDLGYYWLRILFYIMVSIGAGTLDFNIGTSSKAILARGRCDAYLYGIMTCLSIGGLPFITEEIKVFKSERLSGHYGEAVYVLSNFLSSFPFIVVISFTSGSILYYMVNFHPGFSHLLYFCINLFCYISASEACALVVASLISNPLMAMGVAVGVAVFNLMASNMSRRLSDLPKIFWRYPMSYISYISWGMQGLFKNDMSGLEFDHWVHGNPKLKGETILETIYGINPNNSKWWDAAALVCLLIIYKLLFYIALKYKKRVSSLLHRFYTKIILQRRHSLRFISRQD